MILLDYSQVAISNLHQQIKTPKGAPAIEVKPALLRHMILNSIRKANREFGKTYGQIVICSDNSNYWRKTYFKNYKSNRRKDRDDSPIDWHLVFQTLNELREEIKETFPYKVLNVSMAEADDIIGVIAKHFHTQEKILILSGDHDFQQLQVYPGVEQYSSVHDKFIVQTDPKRFLLEHILRGDKGDGVPNFLSDDDVFIAGGRQAPIFEAKVDVWVTQKPEEFCDERMLRNYHRNQKLVDLALVPTDIEAAILEEFAKPIIGSREKIYPYLVKHRMANLLDLIREF